MQRSKWAMAAAALMLGGCASAVASGETGPSPWHLVPGSIPEDKGPDGNSVFLDAPDGLILVDSGRHPAHRDKLLAYAHERGRPIVAIVNTHWHLDHTTGNHDIRQVFPRAEVYATAAIEGALVGFLGRNRAQADKILADPKTPPERKAEILRGRSVIDNPDRLRATRPVLRSATTRIAGKRLQVNVAPFAATEADMWLYDPASRTAIVGDLVVGLVPFMDSACPDGWSKALGAIAATPFTTLIPGHGAPMDRPAFLRWQGAFNALVECGRSARPTSECAKQWSEKAAPFIDPGAEAYAAEAVDYYIMTRLRSSPAEQQKFCRPLTAAS